MDDNTEELVPKKNSTPVIWNWFGFSINDTPQTTVTVFAKIRLACRIATRCILFNHLKRKHPKQYADSQTVRRSRASASATTTQPEATRPKQTALMKALEIKTLYGRTRKRWKEVTDAVTF